MKREELMEVLDMYHEKTRQERASDIVAIQEYGRENMKVLREFLEMRMDRMDERFDGIDERLDRMDRRFDGVDMRLDNLETRMEQVEFGLCEILRDMRNHRERIEVLEKENAHLREQIALLMSDSSVVAIAA